MKLRKPDRVERMVLSRFERWRNAVGDTAQWHSKDVIKLLRREHAWMMRMVQKRQRYRLEDGVMFPSNDGAWVMVDLIIDELEKRRK